LGGDILDRRGDSFFTLVILGTGSHIFVQASLNFNPIYTSRVTGLTVGHHHVQLLMEMGGVSLTFLVRIASNCNLSDLHLLKIWDYRHEPLPTASFLFFNVVVIVLFDIREMLTS
jgi:hypothetical protein